MTFLYTQSFTKRPAWGASFQFGGLFGLIATLPLYLILYAIWDFSLAHLLVDSVWHLVEQGVGAMVLGAVLFARTGNAAASL